MSGFTRFGYVEVPVEEWQELQDAKEAVASLQAEAKRLTDVDALAQIIRTVDGNHSLGAGALAEAIVNALLSREDEP